MNLFSKLALATCLATAAAVTAHAQTSTTLADWTFERAPGNSTGSDYSYGEADSGLFTVGSSADGHHASTATVYGFTGGDGGGKSLGATHWAVNDYWQFSLTNVGYQNLMVSFAQTSTATGPAIYQFQYSTDGSSFTNFGSTYAVTNAFATQSFDLSTVSTLDTAASLYFRVVDTSTTAVNGGTVGTAGADRLDDFVVSGELAGVPEPSVYMLLGVGLLFCGQRFLRHRRAV